MSSLDVIDPPEPRRRGSSVRTIRLAGVGLGAIFLLVLAAAEWADYQTTLRSTRSDLTARASAFAWTLDEGLSGLRAVYSAVSVQASDTTEFTDEDLSAYLDEVLASGAGLARSLVVVDPTGRVRGAGMDASNFSPIRERLSSVQPGFRIHAPDRSPAGAIPIIPVTWRGPRAGQFIVGGGIPIARLSELFERLTDSEASFSGVVLRDDGLVLAVLPGADLPNITAVTDSAQAVEQIRAGPVTFLEGPAIDGEGRLSAFRSATSVGVIAGVSVTRADALAPFGSRLLRAGLLGLLGLLVIAVGTEYQARQSTALTGALAQLEEVNVGLERTVEERTQELVQANADLEAFAYSVSHDLKTPLRAIDGYSGMLEESFAPSASKDVRRLVKNMRESTRSMGRLIDDLLEFARVGRIEMTISGIDMRELVETVFSDLMRLEGGRTVEFSVAHLPTVQADLPLVRQVWVNLLQNALKFSRGRDVTRIDVASLEEPDHWVFHVRDNGAGFDMTYVDKLFGVFQRLHYQDEFPGTGVGLATVQRIVQRHGGEVWAEGVVDQGASIFFRLPRSVASPT